MIDGMRYAFIGHADGSLTVGVVLLVAVNAALWTLCWRMFKTGYGIKE